MRHRKLTLAAAVTLCCVVAATTSPGADAKSPAWKPLFDGKTISGWHEFGEKDGWTVKDGALLGHARQPKLYALLVSDREYADFTVRLKFKMFEGNSGVYIRTALVGADEAHGPQIEIAPNGSNFTSGIYESYGRNWLAQPSEAEAVRLFKPDAWNELVICADGPHVTVRFNGVKTVDFHDPKGRSKGYFILQQHAGMVNRVMFKDIEILAGGD
jgi:hypothetical protein